MVKQDICDKMESLSRDLDIPIRSMVLSAGGALVLLGIRETTNDLDISVPERVYLRLKGSYPEYPITGNRNLLRVDAVSDFHIHDPKTGVIFRRGIVIYNPSALIKQKKELLKLSGRSKEKLIQDQKDIDALYAYLSGEGM